MDNVIEPPSSIKFHCDNCYYHTIRKSQYERHLLTTKHKNAIKYYDLNFTSSNRLILIVSVENHILIEHLYITIKKNVISKKNKNKN